MLRAQCCRTDLDRLFPALAGHHELVNERIRAIRSLLELPTTENLSTLLKLTREGGLVGLKGWRRGLRNAARETYQAMEYVLAEKNNG